MIIDRVVVDASPLILLSKVDLVGLLPKLFTEIVVPDLVWEECTARGASDSTVPALASIRAKRVTWEEVPPEILVWNLGDGESAVLTFALANRSHRAVVDDKAGRSCARALGIDILGTGGVLILAKRRGLVESVANELQKLVQAGLWISEELVDLLLRQAGESR